MTELPLAAGGGPARRPSRSALRGRLRLARFSVELWENPEARERLAGILRAAVSEPEAAQMARELATERFVGAISESLGVDDAPCARA